MSAEENHQHAQEAGQQRVHCRVIHKLESSVARACRAEHVQQLLLLMTQLTNYVINFTDCFED